MEALSSIVIDGVLAVLLVAVIIVSSIVYRRLGTIKSGQAELRQLVDQLNNAVVEAQRSVASLRQSASEVEDKLLSQTRKASALADELGMITEAGNNLADRIERGLTSGNSDSATTRHGDSALDEASTAQGKKGAASKKQQREILAALREAR